MPKLLFVFIFAGFAVLIPFNSFSQYILNGNATKESCNCYVLTQPVQTQIGSVWQSKKINLNNPFDFNFNVYLGCIKDGADGIVFILQPNNTSIGAHGQGLGFEGIVPSVGVSLDTYQNFPYDPVYDHISIQQNGVIDHSNDLAGPIPASSTSDNIKDCAWHILRVKWDPATQTLSTYFDGVFRLSTKTNLLADIFKNDPMVYWGFSGATGGSFNLQKFCTPLNPGYNTNLVKDAICFGSPVVFTDNSTSFTTIKNFYWDFGDGNTSVAPNPPPHNYSQPGIYQLKHTITGEDGCVSQPFTKTISIGDKPEVSFKIFDTCENITPRINLNEKVKVGNVTQWKWYLDGLPFSNSQNPDLTKLSPGNHSMKLSAVSDIGCASDIYNDDFTIKNTPEFDFTSKNECANTPVLFSARQTDFFTTVSKWQWDFGDQGYSTGNNVQHIYRDSANYPVRLIATASNGCVATVLKNIFINSVKADAGKDTLVLPLAVFQLHGSGGSIYSWMPGTGLSNPDISSPMGNINDDITYHLTVKTVEGCTDTASVKVVVFKGSDIYVPNAFTPNNDGLNDVLKPYFIGIKSLDFFSIYDRWGKKVFSTNEMNKGWDGYSNGKISETSTYVWVLKATDVVGRVYNLKGSFTLIK
jgi:gliding motility-associated-like protein